MLPIVSVILTVFKRTEYLEEAIQSVLAQTFQDFELIVTDDAATEAAQSICAKYGKDSRIRYRRNDCTLGAPLNIAAAMRETRGKYATIINDDDAAEPFMLEKLIGPLEQNSECVVCFGDYWVMDSSSKLIPDITEWFGAQSRRCKMPSGMVAKPFKATLVGTVPFVMGALFRRDAYHEEWMVKEVAGAYDRWMCLHIALLGRPFYYVNERLFRYRLHPNSESARQDAEKVQCEIYMFRSLLQENISAEDCGQVKMHLARFLFILGRDRLYFGENAGARRAFLEAAANGLKLKPYLGFLLSYLPAKWWRVFMAGWRLARGIKTPIPSSE